MQGVIIKRRAAWSRVGEGCDHGVKKQMSTAGAKQNANNSLWCQSQMPDLTKILCILWL